MVRILPGSVRCAPGSVRCAMCGNASPDTIGPHVGIVDQPQIVTAKDLPKRPRRSAIVCGCVVAADSGVQRCVAAQQPRHTVDPMLALTVLGIKYPFPRDLE